MKQLTVILQVLMVAVLVFLSIEVYRLTREIKGIRQEQVKNEFYMLPTRVTSTMNEESKKVLETPSYVKSANPIEVSADTPLQVEVVR